MTREEAIYGLKVLAKDFSGYKPNEEMFDMAIKALEQPECEDAVSRFEVLRLIDYSSHDLNDSVDNRYMQNEIKQLPSVTPKQPGWIPVTERLPDNDRAVLVTLKWAEDDYEVAVGEYWHNSTASHGWGSFEGHVIAWHELPKPYREGGQDG